MIVNNPSVALLAKTGKVFIRIVLVLAAAIVVGALVWQGITSSGAPDPTLPHLDPKAVIMNTGLLVFREGLEVILVLAAITASLKGKNHTFQRPIAIGAGLALLAGAVTWFVAIALLNSVNAPALDVQAATGLLAIVVLLVIMNWFFHKIYWTAWISMHNKRRKTLMKQAQMEKAEEGHQARTSLGFALLGFSAMYRECFEVVLFLQNLRLQAGSTVVLQGVVIGMAFTSIVGVLTFIVNRKLPYKKMLIATGAMLAIVLLVMVGESVQEMQQASWISTTALPIPLPEWLGVWFAIFPNVEGLAAQAFAGIFVIGSYFLAQYIQVGKARKQSRSESMELEPAL